MKVHTMEIWKKITDLNISDEDRAKFILKTGTKELFGIGRYRRNVVPVLIDLFEGKIAYTTSLTSKNGWTDGYNFDSTIRLLLQTLNLPYETGNDAPRGGKNGNWIKLKNW